MQTQIPKKIGDMEYIIEPDSSNGMNVPVRIFADEKLLTKMTTDRTIWQATNVASIPGIVSHVAVLPDGHEEWISSGWRCCNGCRRRND